MPPVRAANRRDRAGEPRASAAEARGWRSFLVCQAGYPDLDSGLPSPGRDKGLTRARRELFPPPVPRGSVCKTCTRELGAIDRNLWAKVQAVSFESLNLFSRSASFLPPSPHPSFPALFPFKCQTEQMVLRCGGHISFTSASLIVGWRYQVHTGILKEDTRTKKKKGSSADHSQNPHFSAQYTRLPRKDPTNRNTIPSCI